MAQHAPLTAFLAQADADVGPGTSHEFLASTGRRLVTDPPIAEVKLWQPAMVQQVVLQEYSHRRARSEFADDDPDDTGDDSASDGEQGNIRG